MTSTDDQPCINFNASGEDMLRVAPDGFYIRGIKVPVDDNEALKVYNCFKQWLTWAVITQNNE
jgi:hypothetical protein